MDSATVIHSVHSYLSLRSQALPASHRFLHTVSRRMKEWYYSSRPLHHHQQHSDGAKILLESKCYGPDVTVSQSLTSNRSSDLHKSLPKMMDQFQAIELLELITALLFGAAQYWTQTVRSVGEKSTGYKIRNTVWHGVGKLPP